jgi:hypothetical protein
VNFPEGAAEAILGEIVRSDAIARQSPRIARKTGYQGFDLPVKTAVDGTSAVAAFRNWVLAVRIYHRAPALLSCRGSE